MGKIGVFDSGYGGLTVLKEIQATLPNYNYLYLGDNARAPYGDRSFDLVHEFTLQAVKFLFKNDCPLVILACNTSSAKALRNIQQNYLIKFAPEKKVLGVIRPSTEEIGNLTKTKCIGILGTKGTIESNSYLIELNKFFPEVKVYQHACPLWVPLIENGLHQTPEGLSIIKKDVDILMKKNQSIDTLVLACTHYPIVEHIIKRHLGKSVKIVSQGKLVARKLKDYLERHPEIEVELSKGSEKKYLTTENQEVFDKQSEILLGSKIKSTQVLLI